MQVKTDSFKAEITPEMLEAGSEACHYWLSEDSIHPEDVAVQVWSAMRAASQYVRSEQQESNCRTQRLG